MGLGLGLGLGLGFGVGVGVRVKVGLMMREMRVGIRAGEGMRAFCGDPRAVSRVRRHVTKVFHPADLLFLAALIEP